MPSLSSIRVGVRARPLGYNELRDGCQSCVGFPGDNDIVIGGTKQFSFDHVFSDQATQEEIYKQSVRDMINNLFVGYNVTVLAYGQTGSGKTFTMGTNFSDRSITANAGVIPRAVKDIYDYLEPFRDKATVCVKVSFIEVYNEEIFDLLSNGKEIRSIREENQDVKIPNLIEKHVNSSEEIFRCLLKGSENRAVGSTAMNETSSRSHAIFTIYISILPLPDAMGTDNFEPISSKLHLVDLAGSERASKTQATGDRFKEGVNINRGLLALGNVISSLVEKDKNKNKAHHIPYRESKLTRLLQDSLGGNTKTLMLACVSPADSNFEETNTTLNYAARARQIQNRPVINKVDSAQSEIYQLRAEVTALKAQLRNVMGNEVDMTSSFPPPTSSSLASTYFSKICELEAELSANQRQKLDLIEEFDEELSQKNDFLKKLWEKLQIHCVEKDETYYEIEKMMMEIASKEENTEEHVEENDTNEQLDNPEHSPAKEKTAILRGLREELRSKVDYLKTIENADTLTSLQHYEDQNRELNLQIKNLEEEKVRATQKHRQDDLDIHLKEAKKQLHELNILKKEREQRSNEIKQLKLKIDDLKIKIVKVCKELDSEKRHFRKINAEKDKQVKSLLYKDRLLHYEMEKKDVQHAKEIAVLQRRVESSAANGKRLKEMLENRKNYSAHRTNRTNTNKNIFSQVKLWIRQSLEQATDRCETRQRFNLLIEDRRKVTEQLEQLAFIDSDKKSQLEMEIKRLNECISQLQQVELTEDTNDIQVQACWNQLRNINECKIAIRCMFKQLVQERVNSVMVESELQQTRELYNSLEKVNATLHTELEKARSENDKKLQRSISLRRSSMLIKDSDVSKNGSIIPDQEPPFKRQKISDRFSDCESVGSNVSSKSRLSYRISQACRCKNGCKPSRCGCLKSSEPCSSKCLCKGKCEDQRQSILPDISENKSDSESDPLNRTFDNPRSEDHILNRSFVISDRESIPLVKIEDEDDKENINNQTIVNKEEITITESLVKSKNLLISSNETNSKINLEANKNSVSQRQYFESPSSYTK